MKNKFASLIITCSLVMGACVPAFASSVTPSNLTPYLQSNSGYYWINPNTGYSSTVSSGTKLVDMIGQLGGNLTQGIFNILSKLSNTGRIYLYNYSGTNTSYNAGTSLGDLVGYGLQNLTQTNSFIYDKVDDLLTSVNSIKGYVDGVETGLTSVNTNLSTIKSDTNSIKGYIDGLEQGQADIVDAVEGISIPTTDLTTVHSYLNNIASDVELNEINTSGIDDTLDYIADQMFLSSSGTLADDIENILYSNRDILNGLGYSYGDTLKGGINGVVNVGSDIVSSVDNVHVVNSTISAINSDILAINTTMSAIQTSIAGINESIHSDTTDLNTKVQKLTDNYNNIDWVNFDGFNGVKNTLNGDFLTSNTYSTDFYIFFYPKFNTNIYKINVPLRTIYNSLLGTLSFEVGMVNNNNFSSIDGSVISYERNAQFLTLYVYIGDYTYQNRDIVIHTTGESPYSLAFAPGQNQGVYYINSDSKDFYDVQNWVYNFNFLDILRDAKEMFFDDDTIALKKQEKSKSDTALGTITGTGSASASGDDFSGVGDTVSSVKSGLSTGTNVSNILGVFNNSDGYSWFSSETANDIDQVNNTNTRLLRSNSNNEYPLVSQRLNELYSVMGGLND